MKKQWLKKLIDKLFLKLGYVPVMNIVYIQSDEIKFEVLTVDKRLNATEMASKEPKWMKEKIENEMLGTLYNQVRKYVEWSRTEKVGFSYDIKLTLKVAVPKK